MASVKPVPQGLHTVTPQLVVKGGVKAIEFYKKAFGAQEKSRALSPDGRVMHAELQVGDSIIFLADEYPEIGTKAPVAGQSPVTLQIFNENVDELFNRAVSAGALPGVEQGA